MASAKIMCAFAAAMVALLAAAAHAAPTIARDEPVCPYPYYPTPAGSSATADAQSTQPNSLDAILPLNAQGEAMWKSIFPTIDPASPQYAAGQCGSLTGVGRPEWAPGCYMFGSGDLSGLANFRKAAALFPQFCNGPDAHQNLMELAAFFGNVQQETSWLLYSAELTSSQMSEYGKGALQLTGANNYVLATLGLAGPQDYYAMISMSGQLTGDCATQNVNVGPSSQCWQACSQAQAVPAPHGSGFNVCQNPSTASSDPIAAWAVSIWYWMNVPINPDVANNLGLQGNVPCRTAHNLVQDGSYDCVAGGWCPTAAMAQIGCPSCCTTVLGPDAKPDPMSVNRVGGYVKTAIALNDPAATADPNGVFCLLLNRCVQGAAAGESTVCSGNTAGYSYDCYLTNSCGGGPVTKAICGGVPYEGGETTGVSCKAIPNNPQGAKDSDCAACEGGQQWWPCDYVDISGVKTPLCQWVTA